MKLIKFDLPIDGTKVRTREELRDHFTPEILELYRNGLLTKWLASRQLSQELSAIKAIEVQEDQALLQRLCEIFDIQADEDFIRAACATAAITPTPVVGEAEPKLRLTLPMDGVQLKTREELRRHFTSEILDHYHSGLLAEWLLSRELRADWAAVSELGAASETELLGALARIFDIQAGNTAIASAVAQANRPERVSPRPDTLWIEPHTGMVFVWIPPGEIVLGRKVLKDSFNPPAKYENYDCLNPLRNKLVNQSYTLLPYIDTDMTAASLPSKVRVNHEKVNPEEVVFEIDKRAVTLGGFWMGQSPVTQAQWRTVMANNPSRYVLGDEYPMDSVSLDDALGMVRLLKAMHQGRTPFRLPNAIEWLYAAGALSDPVYWQEGWYSDNEGLAKRMVNYGWFDGAPHPVGQKPANPLGLYDMLGNVEEWTIPHGEDDTEALIDIYSSDVTQKAVQAHLAGKAYRYTKIYYVRQGTKEVLVDEAESVKRAGIKTPEFQLNWYRALLTDIDLDIQRYGASQEWGASNEKTLAGFRLLRPA